MGVVAVCLDVFTTRMELEHVSEIAEAEKPITALRSRRLGRSSYWGKYSFRKLYCSTATEVTEHCHMRVCLHNLQKPVVLEDTKLCLAADEAK